MKPPAFAYAAPKTLDETLALLARHGEDAKVLAGGQSLVPLLNFRLARPELLIDVNRVTGLAGVRRVAGTLRIGALTRHAAVERSLLVTRHWPLLSEAIGCVAHAQIRNRGTIGGSVAHADPAAEIPVVLTALDARFHVASTRGRRVLDCGEMFVDQLQSGIALDELLTEIELPPMPQAAGSAWLEFARRHGDYALGGAGAVLSLDGAGRIASAAIALLGAGRVPLRASAAELGLRGAAPELPAFTQAAADAVRDIEPAGSIHGSSAYRRDLIGTLVRRALVTAAERAPRQEEPA